MAAQGQNQNQNRNQSNGRDRTRTINPRQHYHDLTPKMRAVVDAVAEHPDAGHREIAERASEKLEDDTVSRSYVPAVIEQQSHIIDERREIVANERFEGEERTEGDPFEGLLDDPDTDTGAGFQTIQERPVTDVGVETETETNVDATDRPATIAVELSQTELEDVLSNPDTPAWLRERVTQEVVNRAFD